MLIGGVGLSAFSFPFCVFLQVPKFFLRNVYTFCKSVQNTCFFVCVFFLSEEEKGKTCTGMLTAFTSG